MSFGPHFADIRPAAGEPALWRRWELPTWGIAVVIYAGWLFLTWWHALLPGWIIVPLGAWFICWHSHLQHEVLHGHPTRIAWLNELIVFPALSLWFPYGVYRDRHLAHHADWHLTCPVDDPESFYTTPERWRQMSSFGRTVLRFNNTVSGRLLVGPFLASRALYGEGAARLLRGDTSDLWSWVRHALGCALVIAWLNFAGFPLWLYVPCAWFSISLVMLRSYAEHRPAKAVAHRSTINLAERPFGLLFLNNNLHAVHHARPGMPWYELPDFFRAHRDAWFAFNGDFVWNGYRDLFRQFTFRVKDEPVHPRFDSRHCSEEREAMGI